MLSQRIRRIAVSASVVAAVGAVPLVAASPASATVKQYEGVVRDHGYIAGPKVESACSRPSYRGTPNALCPQKRVIAGVKYDVADTACQWA